MVAVTRYTVTAERGAGPVWVFQCREHPGAISESRRLSDAHRLMREAIAFVADVDEADIEIELAPVLPEPVSDEVERARQAVRALAEQQRAAAALSRQAATRLADVGLTGADVATLLEISPQRVSQLLASSRARASAAADRDPAGV